MSSKLPWSGGVRRKESGDLGLVTGISVGLGRSGGPAPSADEGPEPGRGGAGHAERTGLDVRPMAQPEDTRSSPAGRFRFGSGKE